MSYVKRKYLWGEAMPNRLTSILPPEMKGVMFISGYRGKGKTYLASQADFPTNIAFFDFEDKGEGIDSQIHFGFYKAISQAENNPLTRCKLLLETIDNLKADKYTVAIFDNISPLENGLEALIMSDTKSFSVGYGKTQDAIINDKYAARRGVASDLINDLILKPLYTKGIKLVIATSHVKAKYNEPGKMRVLGKDKWHELSILSLVLIDGDNHPIPSAIVMKEQLASISVSNNFTDEQITAIMRGDKPSHIITRRIPDRLSEATFQKIRWYLHNPANINEPTEGEELIDEEVEPFTERLSKEQIAIKLLMLENQRKEQAEIEAIFNLREEKKQVKIAEEVKKRADKPLPTIKSEIQAMIDSGQLEYDGEITIGEIMKMKG